MDAKIFLTFLLAAAVALLAAAVAGDIGDVDRGFFQAKHAVAHGLTSGARFGPPIFAFKTPGSGERVGRSKVVLDIKSNKKGVWDVELRSGHNVKKLVLTKKCAGKCNFGKKKFDKTEEMFAKQKSFRGNPNQAPNLKKWQLKSAVRKWLLESAVERCMEEKNSCECIRNKINKRRGSGCAECLVCKESEPTTTTATVDDTTTTTAATTTTTAASEPKVPAVDPKAPVY